MQWICQKKNRFTRFNTANRFPHKWLWFIQNISATVLFSMVIHTQINYSPSCKIYIQKACNLGILKGRQLNVCGLKFRYSLENMSLLTDKLFTVREFLSHEQKFHLSLYPPRLFFSFYSLAFPKRILFPARIITAKVEISRYWNFDSFDGINIISHTKSTICKAATAG